jgi:hypothetical protein
MAPKRTGYAPYSLTREAGVQSATVNGTIDVIQEIRPVIDSGFLNETGDWKGRKSSDEVFIAITKDEAIPSGAAILTPNTNADGSWPLDMTGYQNLFFAIKVTNAGNYEIKAVNGPDTVPFANLSPTNAGTAFRGNVDPRSQSMDQVLVDSAENLSVADVWNIFPLKNNRLADIRNLQFSITNNSGDISTIETAFMRLV